MSTLSALPVGFTMGDAAGIGPEIIAKTFAGGLTGPAVVYGDAGVMSATLARLGMGDALQVRIVSAPALVKGEDGIIPVLNRWQALSDIVPGRASAQAGRGAYEYLCHAMDDAMSGELRAIVTAPLNKKTMQAGGADYPGHTEILAERSGTKHYAMMLANHELRVILVTIHVALADVPALVTLDTELQTIRLAHRACRQAGVAHPRIAVAGLNPHAGEEGRFGLEEAEIIAPAVRLAREEGLDASGPWPGDTVFMRARRGEFDIVVAQYHDQGLIPVKYLGLDAGVNVTVGLPFVRTSVDHGTAFDIAGLGVADPSSLRAAYDLALAMTVGTTPT
ncbi:4-hydroxythreonine-4-phosphate dehydrogenase PdxA [Allopusillimonas soli]|uniref:4-hydroxythreonine-4-phosphate dehydrogenase PdxA n=1 Tax=Allopusillimonas soli TaxID=659016 RepID=A0A853FFI3_9BURK|nr:4-hydroxythreonine-4-phosphate dehydrogenase PdxA [Allopusillimonas soli]NYT38442.1 4-hydroxythreonine-4-phosphate dehydrogenase PdxA [Allopusillimonas soli]TEA72003.1 4-hydroxythreonine-4-phosphate dehydrogenase PdxA [Allopusillimonas soli]